MGKASQQLKGKTNPFASILNEAPVTLPAAKEPAPAPKRARTTKPKSESKPSRENTRMIGGHFPQEWQRQLALIAAEEGKTKQDLLSEALNDLFVKKGKKKLSV